MDKNKTYKVVLTPPSAEEISSRVLDPIFLSDAMVETMGKDFEREGWRIPFEAYVRIRMRGFDFTVRDRVESACYRAGSKAFTNALEGLCPARQ